MIHNRVPALRAEFHVQFIQLHQFEQEGIQCVSFSLPLIAFLLALAVGIRGNELALIVLAMGSPLATVSFSMCQAYDSDAELAAELVVTTSVFCCLSLFLWIFVLKQMGIV